MDAIHGQSLSKLLKRGQARSKLSVRVIAARLAFTQEQIVDVLEGRKLPPTILLIGLCRELRIDRDEALRLLAGDQIWNEFGRSNLLGTSKYDELVGALLMVRAKYRGELLRRINTLVRADARRNGN